MKLDEFIATVLQDINNGLNIAMDKTDRKYFVKSSSDKEGVHFDIAVTTTSSTGSKAEGTAKAGIIQVLGAGVGAEIEDKNENSQVSRIQFSVYVPNDTRTEEAADRSRYFQQNESLNEEN